MITSVTGIYANSYGVFFTSLSEALGAGMGDVALHASLAGLVSSFAAIASIRLLGRIPVRIMMAAGAVLLLVPGLILAFSRSILLFNLLGPVQGIGYGCFNLTVAAVIIERWFTKNTGTVLGFVFSFAGISGAVFAPLLTLFIGAFGYRTAYILMNLIAVALIAPCVLWMKLPEDADGETPGGSAGPEASGPEKPGSGADTMPGGTESAGRETKRRCGAGVYAAFVVLSLTMIFCCGFTQFMPSYTETMGRGAEFGSLLLSSFMVGNLVFGFVGGALSDRLGIYKVLSGIVLCTVAGLLILSFMPRSSALLYLASFLFGSGFSAGNIGMPILSAEVFGREDNGRMYSVMAAVSQVAYCLSLIIIGFGYDITRSYRVVLAMLALTKGINLAMIWVIALAEHRGRISHY